MSRERNSINDLLVSKAESELREMDVPVTSSTRPATSSVQNAALVSQATAVDASSTTAPVASALSLRGEIFHAFISYRVKSEADLVGELYHRLITSAKAAKIPQISRWPSKFKEPTKDVASSRMHVFWDAKCLAPGLTWKDNGFVSALSMSLVFVPLLSNGVVEKWVSPVVEYVDNVLLELVLALEFNHANTSDEHSSSVFPCKYIMPVFVDDLFSMQNSLSKDIARKTMEEATRLLQKYGIRPSCEYSPHGVFTALGAFQGLQMFVFPKQLKQQALDAVVKDVMTAVTMCIHESSVFLDDFKAHHPRARELLDWLQTHNLSRYAGVIARHGVTSVYALSLLDVSSTVPIIADDCALSSGESRIQAIVSLSRAVAVAKSSELSLSLSERFNRFVDTESSVLSALFSSCGVDAALAKAPLLLLLLLSSFICANMGTFVINILDEPFLSVCLVVNPLFWFFFSAALFCLATWPFFFGGSMFRVPSTEFKPRKIAAAALLFFPWMSTIIVVYIKAGYFGSISFRNSILCDAALRHGALTVSYDTCYLYEIFVVYPVQFIAFCASSALIYERQELAFRAFCVTAVMAVVLFFGLMSMVTHVNLLALRLICGGILATCICGLSLFEGLNMLSKRKASQLLKHDENLYTEKWDNVMKTSTVDAKNLSEYIKTRFGVVFDDPSAHWFSRRPHLLQEHSSVDNLFDDVELVDVAFQELVQCWLKGSCADDLRRFVHGEHLESFALPGMRNIAAQSLSGPVKQVRRSISKTIRSYRGNYRRLTDLVRTTIVFQTFADIHNFLKALHEKSECSSQDILPSNGSPLHIENSSNIIMQIMRVRNRFDPDPVCSKYLFGGYRDISLKIKMAFVHVRSNSIADCVKFVPMSRWHNSDAKRLVFEIQLHHKDMQLGNDAFEKEKHHRTYVRSRDVMSV